jgi:hypothetical protein
MPVIRAVMPYLKDAAIEGADGFIKGVREGKSIREAGETQLRKSATDILTDMAKKVQKGSGIRKGRKRKQKPRKERKRTKTRPIKKVPPLFH